MVDFEKALPDDSRVVVDGGTPPDATVDVSVPPALAVGASSGSHAAATPFKRKPTLPKPSEYAGRCSVPTPKSVAPVATKRRIGRVTVAKARRNCENVLMSDDLPNLQHSPVPSISQNAEA